MDNKTKLSIIIVTYNCEELIEDTLKSIIIQKNRNFEVIIIDGKSSDDTIVIAKNILKNSNIKYKVISEKDNGIYDAMNKGIDLSIGEYLYFINAGDILYNEFVISDFIKYEEKNLADIFYGDTVNVKEREIVSEVTNNYPIKKQIIFKGICHQSIFAKKSTFKYNKFDIKYKISADFNWLIKCLNLNYKFMYFPKKICKYDIDGISSSNKGIITGSIEYIEIIRRNITGIYKILGITRGYYRKYKAERFNNEKSK